VGGWKNLHAARHAVGQLVAGVDLLEEDVRMTFGADGKGHEAAKEW
jgi:hypothetical protein